MRGHLRTGKSVCYTGAMQATATPRKIPPLRAVREAQGLGLRETARLAGVGPQHLSRIERGEHGCSISTLRKLLDVLGPKPLSDLLRLYDPED